MGCIGHPGNPLNLSLRVSRLFNGIILVNIFICILEWIYCTSTGCNENIVFIFQVVEV